MKKIKTTGSINYEGKLSIANRKKFESDIAKYKDKQVVIEVTCESDNISHQQRKYIFGLMAKMIKERLFELGNEKVTLPGTIEWMKDTWYYRESYNPISNKVIKVHISFSNSFEGLEKAEFQEKKELVQMWAAQNIDINIPDPDPNWKMYRE